MKSNSSSASIKLGYKLYASHFTKIFRATWLPATVYAVICSVLGTLTVNGLLKLALITQTAPELAPAYFRKYLALLIAGGTLVIVGGLCELAFYACGLSLLYSHKTTGALPSPARWMRLDRRFYWRTVKAALTCLLFLLTTAAVCGGVWLGGMAAKMPTMATEGLTAVIGLVLLVLFLPFCHIELKYLLNPDTTTISVIASDYKTGLRHLGFIFAVALFGGVILLIAQNVLTLPAILLGIASFQANLGALAGDPLNMPSYTMALTVLLFFIAGFIQAYVRLSILFPFYYMTGSIDTQEEERRRYQEETQNNDTTILTSK